MKKLKFKIKIKNFFKGSTERISQHIFYMLIGVITFVFMLFYLIGFDLPFEDDPNFNAPLFTDFVLYLMYLLTAGTIGIGLWSMWRSLKERGTDQRTDNNIPVKRISYSISIAIVVLLLITFIIGSSSEMMINGKIYKDVFWLKIADMFIWTIIILMITAIGAVIYGAKNYNRKDKNDIQRA